jgi:hypothetical protein
MVEVTHIFRTTAMHRTGCFRRPTMNYEASCIAVIDECRVMSTTCFRGS